MKYIRYTTPRTPFADEVIQGLTGCDPDTGVVDYPEMILYAYTEVWVYRPQLGSYQQEEVSLADFVEQLKEVL